MWVSIASQPTAVVGFERVGEDGALVTAICPEFSTAVAAADLSFGMAASAEEPLLTGVGLLVVHAVCEFGSFCSGRGMVISEFAILDTPPPDGQCSIAYCMEAPPDPRLVSFNLDYATTVGGEVATVVIANWP